MAGLCDGTFVSDDASTNLSFNQFGLLDLVLIDWLLLDEVLIGWLLLDEVLIGWLPSIFLLQATCLIMQTINICVFKFAFFGSCLLLVGMQLPLV